MSDISLNIKDKSVSHFDIKQYELINEFNNIFSCNNVGKILSIYSKDNKNKINHPLLLNGNYCLFCHEVLNKNLFYLKYNHKEINLKNFLNENKIKLRRVFHKEKIYKRRFIHSTEHNNNKNNNNFSKNEKSQSDTEEYFINNKQINLFIKEDDSNSNTSPLNKEKLEDIIQDINLLPTTISTKNNYKTKLKSHLPSSEINDINNLDTDSNLNLINKKNENNTTSKKLTKIMIKHNSVLYPIKKKISNLQFAKIKSIFTKNSNLSPYMVNLNNNNNDFICNICFDSIHDKYMLECGHFYCKICIIKLINSCLENISMFNKIKCPNEFCQYKINSNIVEDLCDNITFLKYKKFEKRINSLSNEKYIPCPYPNCDGYGEKINIKKNILKCEECHTYFCTICLKTIINFQQKKIEKEKKEKEEKEEENESIDISKIHHNCLESQSKIEKLTEEYCEKNNNIKKCPKCHCWVEKTINNCNNMKCTNIWCNYEFCWICMKKYDNGHYKNPFNECFGLSQSDINSNFANYKGARILKCILISLLVMFILFPMFVNFFSFSLMTLYLKFIDTNRKKIMIKNNKLKYVYVVTEYTFYFLISLALISLGYLVLLIMIICIPIYILIGKCKNEEDNLM